MSDWDRYAAQEYELLVAEEGGETQGWVVVWEIRMILNVPICYKSFKISPIVIVTIFSKYKI